MSRIAKSPVALPSGVEVTIKDQEVTVKGQQGTLQHTIHADVKVEQAEGNLTFAANHNSRGAIALAGTTRALLNNMVIGVTAGFEKKLKLVGVGYRAKMEGKSLNLSLGFSHPVNFVIPDGVVIETPSQTDITVKGIDKQVVGQVAAKIRDYRPPEPYKGKGVRYANESIILKEAKKK